VIVFIHGGLFMFGRAELFRPDYLMDEDVVLVSIHYRLGALGKPFLLDCPDPLQKIHIKKIRYYIFFSFTISQGS